MHYHRVETMVRSLMRWRLGPTASHSSMGCTLQMVFAVMNQVTMRLRKIFIYQCVVGKKRRLMVTLVGRASGAFRENRQMLRQL